MTAMPTPTGTRNDPFSQFRFLVDIQGVGQGAFSEVSGLDAETDPIEYRDGNEDITVRKLPGLRKYTNITLKRGFTTDLSIWDWRKQVMDGQTERKSGSIVLRNEAGEDVLRWNFREGWPCKLQGPPLNAKTNEVAIETLEICHEGLELVPG
jgi:phage tail-like protein